MANLERAFTSFEAAKICGVFHTTLTGWVNRGKLKARYTPGGHRRILLSDLVEFMRKYEIPIPPGLELKQKRILVVEDEALNRRVLARVLKPLPNVEVQTCASGLEALMLIGKEAPDLLILDLYLPGIDGFAVCELLKSNPHTRAVKIIAISGHALTRKQGGRLRGLADCFLRKPFDNEGLKAKAAELLGALG